MCEHSQTVKSYSLTSNLIHRHISVSVCSKTDVYFGSYTTAFSTINWPVSNDRSGLFLTNILEFLEQIFLKPEDLLATQLWHSSGKALNTYYDYVNLKIFVFWQEHCIKLWQIIHHATATHVLLFVTAKYLIHNSSVQQIRPASECSRKKNNHLLYTHLIHSVYNNNPFNSLHNLQNWQQTRHLYHYQTCCWNSGRNSSSAKIWAWNGSWLKRTADFNMTTVSFKRSPHATTDRWRFTADLRKKYNKVNGSYSAW